MNTIKPKSNDAFTKNLTTNEALKAWIEQITELCRPNAVYTCDGSEEERSRLTAEAVRNGDVEELNQELLPGCLYAHSKEDDVARVESLTFICTHSKQDAGPTNNWMAPNEAYQKLSEIFRGSMKGRTMYVIPFLMGVPGSKFNKIGVQLTDSLYVVLNMRIMTRMGRLALDELGNSNDFTRCLHSKADLDDKKRFICHFPEDNTIWSVGTNYGGNVLVGKKCLALRIGSWLGRREGWLAEHMLIMGIQNPKGEIHFVAAAFPSQCGKTNLAMLVPPKSMSGYKIWTVGDDIAWIRPGTDGRLWALNPENGFFGVAPGTNSKTNPNALQTIRRNTIYTNVAKTKQGGVWWEGLDGEPPKEATDWRGRPWTPESGFLGAHPNSRFTAPVSQCPSLWPEWDNPKGVPLDAIIFGGRRARLEPLVYETLDWAHGVYAGATMSSETTAAATGKTGVVRRDPMAMLPFCGYHMGEYFGHWLKLGKGLKHPPKIFHVNWFRRNAQGKFVWPGFGENLRVLQWMLDRVEGKTAARKTPIGFLPYAKDISLDGLDLTPDRLESELFSMDPRDWLGEIKEQRYFFERFGNKLPAELTEINKNITDKLLDEIKKLGKEKAMKSEPTVQDFMTQQPQSIEAKESLEKARDRMSKFGIRHLPVTRDGELIGILSERELNVACGIESIDPRNLLVIDVCSEDPYIVAPDTPLWQVAEVMADKHYGSAMVMEDGVLVGIFTTVDACRALYQVLEKNVMEQSAKRIKKIRGFS